MDSDYAAQAVDDTLAESDTPSRSRPARQGQTSLARRLNRGHLARKPKTPKGLLLEANRTPHGGHQGPDRCAAHQLAQGGYQPRH